MYIQFYKYGVVNELIILNLKEKKGTWSSKTVVINNFFRFCLPPFQ